MLECLPIQGLDGLHAFVELAVSFPSQDCVAQSVYFGSWVSSSISLTFDLSKSPKAPQSRQPLKQGSRSLLRYLSLVLRAIRRNLLDVDPAPSGFLCRSPAFYDIQEPVGDQMDMKAVRFVELENPSEQAAIFDFGLFWQSMSGHASNQRPPR